MRRRPSQTLGAVWGELVAGAILIYFSCFPDHWLFWNFWPLAYMLAVAAVLLIPVTFLGRFLDRKFPPKPLPPDWLCLCGYDLRHNVSGICPECGKSVQAMKKERWRRNHDPDWWESFFIWRK
jgi:hypothetical protein